MQSINLDDKNDKLVDVLMATTAAPTFFPPHKISNKGIFLDGGIHMNHPSSVAYDEAIRYRKSGKNTFVLSMGTGGYIPSALNPNLDRGLLFWTKEFSNVALSAQEGNTDASMHCKLGNAYQRWQIWLEYPIALDDYRKDSIKKLLEFGNQYIEELYCSDDNRMNKLLEFLESDKSIS